MARSVVSTGGDAASKSGAMLVLALDTANERTAVALGDGRRIDVERAEAVTRGHAERLLALIAEVVEEAGVALGQVDRIAVTTGPGSFTGIRVAIAAARGLALALDKPCVGIDSLTALARSSPERPDGPVLAAIDARRGEIYAALFAADGTTVLPPFAGDAEAVLAAAGDDVALVIGSGAPLVTHQAAIGGRRVPPSLPLPSPDLRAVARLARAADPSVRPPVPFYLRPPDAKPQVTIAGLFR